MSPPQFDNAPAQTRNATLGALGASIVVVVFVALGIQSRIAPLFAVAGVAWLVQVALGFIGFGLGMTGVSRRKRLNSALPMQETSALRGWAIGGLMIALLGTIGGIALLALVVVVMGSLVGAWGRPLRAGRKTVSATLGHGGHRWAAGPRPLVDDLDEDTRYALGTMWLHDAKKEHGSVPAFAQLCWQLSVVGAPSALLERCQRGSIEEIDHTRRCFAMSEAYLDCEHHVGVIDEIANRISMRGSRRRCLTRIATETLEDGCFIEDLNADLAEVAHASATDPAAVALTQCIAIEERDHADLAWDILEWCLREDPTIAKAVRRKLDAIPHTVLLPYSAETVAAVGRSDADALVRHGRVPFDQWLALHGERRAQTVTRALAMIDAVQQQPTSPTSTEARWPAAASASPRA